MNKVWMAAVSIAVALFVGAYLFLGTQHLEIYGVSVGQNGSQVNVSLAACIIDGSLRVEVDEYNDRVEIHVKGNQSDSDCSTSVVVSLASPLRNRVVIVGSPKQTFEFCGSDSLCRRSVRKSDDAALR